MHALLPLLLLLPEVSAEAWPWPPVSALHVFRIEGACAGYICVAFNVA